MNEKRSTYNSEKYINEQIAKLKQEKLEIENEIKELEQINEKIKELDEEIKHCAYICSKLP